MPYVFCGSLAYHSNEFKAIDAAFTDEGYHLFATLPMFSNHYILERVKKKITIGTSEYVRVPTGIPPYVKVMDQLKDVNAGLPDVREKLSSVKERIT